MSAHKRLVAAAELILLSPAVLFMTALFLRDIQPTQYEPAHTAERIVLWYSVRTAVGLWLFLMALPLVALLVGCATLWHLWNDDDELRQAARQSATLVRAHLATLVVAAATLTAGAILAIVALHSLAN